MAESTACCQGQLRHRQSQHPQLEQRLVEFQGKNVYLPGLALLSQVDRKVDAGKKRQEIALDPKTER